ncbi:flavin-containing monooxygenase [Leucobacter sp. W1038]|uniref:flavin-containing monooxygenase n=1 Tax=Leucobacter sp. W1038 TaxID=3438281 RepID=UPI003D990FFA
MTSSRSTDVLIVGAGLGGILSLRKMTAELGFEAIVIDKAPGVGGTWYWNRYPGAMSDTQAHVYQLPFENDLYQINDFESRYVQAPQIREYLEKAVDFWNLRDRIALSTELMSSTFDEENEEWVSETSRGTIRSRFLITALGLLSQKNVPDIPGIEKFAGQIVHTADWPADLELAGKKVGVIGNGSTGVQLMTQLAKSVGHLTSFQRTPQYSVPAGNRQYTTEELHAFKANPQALWDRMEQSAIGFDVDEVTRKYADFSPEEADAIFEAAWRKGGNFTFTHETFADVLGDPEANDAAARFIKRKIEEIVVDPETARKLLPTEIFARRPICDSGYFEIFNQPNVTLVRTSENPIREFTPDGVITEDGALHDLDVLVLATGFDAIEGSYRSLDIRGRNGVALNEHWADGAAAQFGVSVSGFPNMFMVLGPLGPFVNLPMAIGLQVRFITRALQNLTEHGGSSIELTAEAEEEWLQRCLDLLEGSLFLETSSWIFGANIPGKKKSRTASYFTGALREYIALMNEETASGFSSYRIAVPSVALRHS